jgi:hypothetical protein
VADRVTVAYVHDNEYSGSFHASFVSLLMWDAGSNRYLLHDDGQLATRKGTDALPEARDLTARRFLDSNSEWLLWIDSDMGFAPDSLDALMQVAHPDERPVVGGLCFASREYATDGMGGHRARPKPTIYQNRATCRHPECPGPTVERGLCPQHLGDDDDDLPGTQRMVAADWYPANRIITCDATGSAFLLIHRSAVRRVMEKFGTCYGRIPDVDGKLRGEDVSFCVRLRELGIPVLIHTGVRTTHYKPQWIAEEDFWNAYTPPPATERCAVIVPVMNRPHNAGPFMCSLRASTGLAAVYAVADKTDVDTQKAWLDAGANVLISDRGYTFAQKANYGYLHTEEPWLGFFGDDVRFHPGWLDHVQHTAALEEADFIATNDLGNRAVLAGRHATHPVMRRTYIDVHGASWDGPGTVAHEGYGHWFVDNEWTAVAQRAGQFAAALGAKVEHLHPIWGKAANDDVYVKGQRSADSDQKVFVRRLKEHAP